MRWHCVSTSDVGGSLLRIIIPQVKGAQQLRLNGGRAAWLRASSHHARSQGPASIVDPKVRYQTSEGGASKLYGASGRWRTSKNRAAEHVSQTSNAEGRILDNETVPLSRSIDTGISIDRKGQLKIFSTARALRRHETVLIVSSTSTNFVSSDFTRLSPNLSDIEAQDDEGSRLDDNMSAVSEGHESHAEDLIPIPGRDLDFNRLPYWILRFKRPYRAAVYQHRLHWYHANAMLNQPIDTYTAATTKKRELIAPEDYIDPVSGENIWKRLNEFSLLLPTQDFNVKALLSPLPASVSAALRNYNHWIFPTGSYKAWPIRIFVDETALTVAAIEEFLSEDGKERVKKWGLVTGIERIEPMQQTTSSETSLPIRGERSSTQQKSGVGPSFGAHKDWVLKFGHKDWVLRFQFEDDALLFWRTWHRRQIPSLPAPSSGGRPCLLHVEPLW